MSVEISTHVLVLEKGALTPDVEHAVLDGAVAAPAGLLAVTLRGPSVADCLQGLLTNDVAGRGARGFVYGAVLTPKGMIVSDLWVARDAEQAALFGPAQGKPALLDQLTKYVPPRLAQVEDVSEQTHVLRLVGPRSLDSARRAGFPVPEAGQVAAGELEGASLSVARPAHDEPFALQIWTEGDDSAVAVALADADVATVTPAALDLHRILVGWPALGAEIDEKTLPQEVRFDEIDGVSYSKGCYTGQETVARLHFRGHANRRLVGLDWEEPPDLAHGAIARGEKTIGRVTSAAWLHRQQGWMGLGVVRGEVGAGEMLTASDAAARVTDLPFDLMGLQG